MINSTDETFDTITSEATTAIVFFSAPWCGPCRTVRDALDEVMKSRPEITVIEHNADSDPIIPTEYNLRALPTLILIVEGQARATHIGSIKPEGLSNWIASNVT